MLPTERYIDGGRVNPPPAGYIQPAGRPGRHLYSTVAQEVG
jgi:hypothetical protein